MQSWAKGIIFIERWSGILAGIVFGLVLSIPGTWITSADWSYQILAAVVAAILGLVSFWLRRRRKQGPIIRFDPPVALRTPTDRQVYARRALVGFVSLYNPRYGAPLVNATPAQWQDAARCDLAALDMPNSNLWPTISAILAHRSRLEHCWLLATPQSRLYTKAMITYLQQQGLNCTFHWDEDSNRERYTLRTDIDESLLFHRSFELVHLVHKEAAALGMGASDIISDFTAGVRSMSIGMILACLGEDRDVEVVGTQFTDDNQPVGALLPLIFRFRPVLDEQIESGAG